MKFAEKTVTLKDGRTAAMYSPSASDAVAMLEYKRKMAAETEFVGPYPEEITQTVEEMAKYLSDCAKSRNTVQISVFVNGGIVGNASIAPVTDRIKLRHRSGFGIAILNEFWGLGIGRLLTEASIASASAMGYEMIDLSMMEGNTAAASLYEKAGFREYGRVEHGFKLKNGRYGAEILMVKYL